MDDMTKEQRRKNMSHIRAQDTKAEILLRKALWHRGIRYRKNYKDLPGKPDIVLLRYKIAIFADGDFGMPAVIRKVRENKFLRISHIGRRN